MDALLRRRAMIAAGGGSPTPPGPVNEPVFYDRLVFDGTAFIETDIVPNGSASFMVTLGNETLKASQRIFGFACAGGALTQITLGASTTTESRQIVSYYGSTSYLKTKNLNFSYSVYTVFMTPKGFGYGDSFTAFTKGSNAPAGGLILGNNPNSGGVKYTGTMTTFKIYGSSAQNSQSTSALNTYTPTHTLRPCTYNGEAGIWCVETSTFYGNTAGAGTLTVQNNE